MAKTKDDASAWKLDDRNEAIAKALKVAKTLAKPRISDQMIATELGIGREKVNACLNGKAEVSARMVIAVARLTGTPVPEIMSSARGYLDVRTAEPDDTVTIIGSGHFEVSDDDL